MQAPRPSEDQADQSSQAEDSRTAEGRGLASVGQPAVETVGGEGPPHGALHKLIPKFLHSHKHDKASPSLYACYKCLCGLALMLDLYQ